MTSFSDTLKASRQLISRYTPDFVLLYNSKLCKDWLDLYVKVKPVVIQAQAGLGDSSDLIEAGVALMRMFEGSNIDEISFPQIVNELAEMNLSLAKENLQCALEYMHCTQYLQWESSDHIIGKWEHCNIELGNHRIRIGASQGGIISVNGYPHSGLGGPNNISPELIFKSLINVIPELRHASDINMKLVGLCAKQKLPFHLAVQLHKLGEKFSETSELILENGGCIPWQNFTHDKEEQHKVLGAYDALNHMRLEELGGKLANAGFVHLCDNEGRIVYVKDNILLAFDLGLVDHEKRYCVDFDIRLSDLLIGNVCEIDSLRNDMNVDLDNFWQALHYKIYQYQTREARSKELVQKLVESSRSKENEFGNER